MCAIVFVCVCVRGVMRLWWVLLRGRIGLGESNKNGLSNTKLNPQPKTLNLKTPPHHSTPH